MWEAVFLTLTLSSATLFYNCGNHSDFPANTTCIQPPTWIQTPRHFFGATSDPSLDLPLIWWVGQGCTIEPKYEGRVAGAAMVVQWEGCSTENKARFAMWVGAAALIILDDAGNQAGRDCWQSRDYSDVSGITIPIYTIQDQDVRPWLVGDFAVRVQLKADVNPWGSVQKHIWIAQVIGCVICAHNFIIALTRWRLFVKQAKGKLRVPVACLSTQVIANLIRMVHYAVDPFGYRSIFPRLAYSIISELGTPFATFSSVMLSIYWREVRDGKRARGFLDSPGRRIQAGSMGLFLLAFNLTINSLLGTYYSRPILRLTYELGFGVLETCVWVWFAYEACKTHHILAAGKKTAKNAETHKQVHRLAFIMILYTFFMFSYSVFRFLGALLVLAPEHMLYIGFFGGATFFLASTTEIYMFNPDTTPSGKDSRRRSSNKETASDIAKQVAGIQLESGKRRSVAPGSRPGHPDRPSVASGESVGGGSSRTEEFPPPTPGPKLSVVDRASVPIGPNTVTTITSIAIVSEDLDSPEIK